MIEPKARTAYSIAMEEEDLESSGTTLVYLKSEAYRYIAHLKRKRCLAMAQVLEHVCPITNRKSRWRDKWHKRWLELAEKFKEAK